MTINHDCFGEEVFPFCLGFDAGEGEPEGEPAWLCTPGRGGRMPQSMGAFSPHFTCALRPQSSHSNTGFHPSLFPQTSHFAANKVLEKINSRGLRFQSASAAGGDALLLRLSLAPFRFAPGLSKENRCTKGNVELRIVEPPSVAAAIESGAIEDVDAV